MSLVRRWFRPQRLFSLILVTPGRSRPAVAAVMALALVGSLAAAHSSRAAPFRASPAVNPPSGGVLRNDGSVAAPLWRGKVGVAVGPISLLYTFDGGVDRPITDLDGGHELRPLGQNGGALRLVPQGLGLAVAYPNRCTLARERDCPRAILEGERDDGLNPGTRPLQYGASVMMTSADLSDGANVVQKGYSVGGGSQFKLQVDHLRGHPSCVIAGQQQRIYRAEPWIDVADGRWHKLACTRTSNRLTMLVDGAEEAWVKVPTKLSIANAEPLRVGGKGPANDNDQFAGQIDDVFVAID